MRCTGSSSSMPITLPVSAAEMQRLTRKPRRGTPTPDAIALEILSLDSRGPCRNCSMTSSDGYGAPSPVWASATCGCPGAEPRRRSGRSGRTRVIPMRESVRFGMNSLSCWIGLPTSPAVPSLRALPPERWPTLHFRTYPKALRGWTQALAGCVLPGSMKHRVQHRSQYRERKPHIDQRDSCAQREPDWLVLAGCAVVCVHHRRGISVRPRSALLVRGDPRHAASRRVGTAAGRAWNWVPQREHRGSELPRFAGLRRQAGRAMTRRAVVGWGVLAKLEKPWSRTWGESD